MVTRERLTTIVSGHAAVGGPMLRASPKALRFARVKDTAWLVERAPGRMLHIGHNTCVVSVALLRVLEREGTECNGAHGGHGNPPTQKPRRTASAGLLVALTPLYVLVTGVQV